MIHILILVIDLALYVQSAGTVCQNDADCLKNTEGKCPYPRPPHPGDTYNCPPFTEDDGFIDSGTACFLLCGNGEYAGSSECMENGQFDESQLEKWRCSPATEGVCELYDGCIWQTCKYGDDSNYWTVNCRPQPDGIVDGCEIYHASNLHKHNGNNQIHCDVCLNLQCGPRCTDIWNDPACHDILVAGHIYPCPEDPTYGGDCQDLSEPHCYLPEVYYPEAAKKGEFKCPSAGLEKGIVPYQGTCVYICNDSSFGGYLTCDIKDGEGVYDETNYMPEMC